MSDDVLTHEQVAAILQNYIRIRSQTCYAASLTMQRDRIAEQAADRIEELERENKALKFRLCDHEGCQYQHEWGCPHADACGEEA